MMLSPLYPLSIAPMMDRTDRHYRYFMRQITRRTLLYTEMVTTAAILHGDRTKLLDFDPAEHPLVLQLGGDNPKALADCARIAQDWGYDAVNLNVGCPSSRVQSGNFGACLMLQPERVAQAVAAMRQAVQIPVTVKHRLGVDEQESYEELAKFVAIVSTAGCTHFIVHARKAWLQGLSPKENRTIPPLRYDWVHQLKQEFPKLTIEINGGITDWRQITAQLAHVDAVMIGRAAYDNPYLFAQADQTVYITPEPIPSRRQVVERMYPYVEHWVAQGGRLGSITRHMLQLFAGQPGTKAWKRHITEQAYQPGAGVEVLQGALEQLHQHSPDIIVS
ncbi:MAG: tRNA dihydrouridine(20/20a) synthase DusA [Spirulina sp. SIO3F2]|nr:tRNA dihydrouridine(20/20a) synthase DusA [Spirulina sp. SIO3F2]